MVETFLHFWPKEVELHVWTEDFNIPVQADNLKQHDVYECPGLNEFLVIKKCFHFVSQYSTIPSFHLDGISQMS